MVIGWTDGWTRADRTVPTRRLIDRFENLGDHSEDLFEHLLVDRVQIILRGPDLYPSTEFSPGSIIKFLSPFFRFCRNSGCFFFFSFFLCKRLLYKLELLNLGNISIFCKQKIKIMGFKKHWIECIYNERKQILMINAI